MTILFVTPNIMSFPRKRESKKERRNDGSLDSRLRGNDGSGRMYDGKGRNDNPLCHSRTSKKFSQKTIFARNAGIQKGVRE
jgi:hypothetical protein